MGLFRLLDLDLLVAARTAPHSSYRNPVERIMSLINLGLQSVGVMRQQMLDEMEKAISNANSMDAMLKNWLLCYSSMLKKSCYYAHVQCMCTIIIDL